MDRFIKDEGKLGHGFTSADKQEKIDFGDESKPRLTYMLVFVKPTKIL
jgi:hypothetical protein